MDIKTETRTSAGIDADSQRRDDASQLHDRAKSLLERVADLMREEEAVLRQASVLRILPPPPATARPAIYASQRQPTSNRRRSTPIDGCLPVAPSAAPLRRSPASGWLAAAQRLNLTTSPGSPNSKCRSQHGSVPRREASPVFVHSRAPSSGGEGPYESRALRPDSGKSTQSTLTCGPTDPSPCRPTLASVAWPETPSPTIAPQGLPGAAAPFHHGNLLHQASHRRGPERVMAWHNATQGRSLRGTACTAPHAASGYTSLPQHGAAENMAPAFKTEQFLAGCKREFGSMEDDSPVVMAIQSARCKRLRASTQPPRFDASPRPPPSSPLAEAPRARHVMSRVARQHVPSEYRMVSLQELGSNWGASPVQSASCL